MKTILLENANHFLLSKQNTRENLTTMKVTTVLEEKIVVFIGLAKIPEHKGSISPPSFHRQLSDL